MKREAVIDTSKWLIRDEAMAILTISARTLDRYAEAGTLRRSIRPVPGRRPRSTYCPEDVDQLAKLMDIERHGKERSMETGQLETPPPNGPTTSELPSLVASAIAGLPEHSNSPQPTYVTLDKAAELTGLPSSFLLKAAKAGKIKAVKAKELYFQRHALEALSVILVLLWRA